MSDNREFDDGSKFVQLRISFFGIRINNSQANKISIYPNGVLYALNTSNRIYHVYFRRFDQKYMEAIYGFLCMRRTNRFAMGNSPCMESHKWLDIFIIITSKI